MPKKKNGRRTDRPQMPYTPGVDQGPDVFVPPSRLRTMDFRWPRDYPPGTYPDWDARQGKARAIAALGSMGTTPRGVTRYSFPSPLRPLPLPMEDPSHPRSTPLERTLKRVHNDVTKKKFGGKK